MNKQEYLEPIINLSLKAISASNMLNRILNEFCYDDMEYLMIEMQEIEHEADAIVHELKKSIYNQYRMAFSREDLFAIAESIDSIIDSLETIAQCFYMFAVKELRHDAKTFANIISDSTKTIYEMILKFKKSRKLSEIEEYIERLKYLEDKGDKLYISANKDLFREEENPVILTKWEEIIFHMEACVDNCNAVGIAVSRSYLKNS